MGGVDILDSLIGRYKIIIRTTKWYMHIFYHLVDLTIVNSWIVYTNSKNQIDRKENDLTVAEFKMEIAEYFCKIGYDFLTKRGRFSSTIEQQIFEKKKRTNISGATKECLHQWNRTLDYFYNTHTV